MSVHKTMVGAQRIALIRMEASTVLVFRDIISQRMARIAQV